MRQQAARRRIGVHSRRRECHGRVRSPIECETSARCIDTVRPAVSMRRSRQDDAGDREVAELAALADGSLAPTRRAALEALCRTPGIRMVDCPTDADPRSVLNQKFRSR